MAPGWYPDYEAPPGHQRYWDGERWTERRREPAAGPGPDRARRMAPWVLAAVAVLVVVSAAALLLGDRGTGPSGAHPPPPASTPGPPPGGSSPPAPAVPRTWQVEDVVDGETIRLANGAEVRLTGIADRCAAEQLAAIVVGEAVTMTKKGADKDADGRLLRYVELDGVDVGKRLIQKGLARASDEPNPRRAIYRRVDARSPDACG